MLSFLTLDSAKKSLTTYASQLPYLLLASILSLTMTAHAESVSNSEFPIALTQTKDAATQYARGLDYLQPESFDADEAFKSITLAAQQQHTDAMHLLGIMYFNGIGTLFDLNQAIYWMEKAASQQDTKSIQRLAVFQELQNHVPAAILTQWDIVVRNTIGEIMLKALQGDADAQAQLGSMYYSGYLDFSTESFPVDKAQSAYWRRKAADQGNIESLLGEGEVHYKQYLEHKNIQDLKQAIKWTRAAVAVTLPANMSSESLPFISRQRAVQLLPQFEQELKQAQQK